VSQKIFFSELWFSRSVFYFFIFFIFFRKQTTTPKGDLTIEHILGHIASLQAFVADADRTAGNKKGRDGGKDFFSKKLDLLQIFKKIFRN
jgi:hypothetical protein